MSVNLKDGLDLRILTDALALQSTDAVADLFTSRGTRPPLVVWSPKPTDLVLPQLKNFASLMQQLPLVDGLPLASAFDPEMFGTLSQWLMLLDVEDGGEDFVYKFYGEGIADHFGHDMSNRSVFDFGGHISLFFAACYRASLQTRETILSEHEPPSSVFVRCWRRIIVPMVSEDGRIVQFAGLNLPESPLRAGLDIVPEPAFIFDRHLALRFANKAALDLFHWHDYPREKNLRALFGETLANGLEELPQNRLVMQCKFDIPKLRRRHFEITAGHVHHAGRPLWVVTLRDITGQLRSERKIKRLAETDVLTGLANRRRFERVLEKLITCGETPFALFLIDLDGFKRVNDHFGHLTGDALLAAVGKRLKRRCRASECVARIGGDEFAIVLPGVKTAKQANQRAKDLSQALDDPFHLDGHSLNTTASIGFARFPAQATDRNGLMLAADRSLYSMKSQAHA